MSQDPARYNAIQWTNQYGWWSHTVIASTASIDILQQPVHYYNAPITPIIDAALP